jgi:hypothetical protein
LFLAKISSKLLNLIGLELEFGDDGELGDEVELDNGWVLSSLLSFSWAGLYRKTVMGISWSSTWPCS